MAHEVKNWAQRRLSPNDREVQRVLEEFLRSEQEFYAQKPTRSRGKVFENKDGVLPQVGEYEEFDVTPRKVDSRRIVVNTHTLDAYVSLAHYHPDSFWYVGKVGELDF